MVNWKNFKKSLHILKNFRKFVKKIEMGGRKPLFKLGPIQSFRKFPDGYNSMSNEDKLKSDSEFYDSFKDPSNIKSKHVFYYAEIIWDDEMYVEHPEKTKVFIEKARAIHGDTYDYSRVNYLTNMRQVEIVCNVHGPFFQRADNHLQGKGCEQCGFIATAEKTKDVPRKKKQVTEDIKKKKRVTLKKKETEKNKVPTLFDVIEEPKEEVKETPKQRPILTELMEKILAKKQAQLKEKKGKAISEGRSRAKEVREQAERLNKMMSDALNNVVEKVEHERKEKKIKELMDGLTIRKKEALSKPNINEEDTEETFVDGIRESFDDFLNKLKHL